jgi:hypothetical protein
VISLVLGAAYFATGVLVALVAFKSISRRDALWWLGLGGGLAILGLLRSVEAGLWVDDYLQHSLHSTGLYEHRRLLQLSVILGFALVLFIALRSLPASARRWPSKVAIGSFYALAVFAAIRSSSWHWSDVALQRQIGSMTLSHGTQLVLLLIILAAGISELEHVRKLNARNPRASPTGQ